EGQHAVCLPSPRLRGEGSGVRGSRSFFHARRSLDDTDAMTILLAVVVELFTSQGCSSCPPADALIRELHKNPNVITIAYHVDYWDNGGWRDPFSSRAWTQRQGQYVESFKLGSSYTPQIVVDGVRQMIGSNAFAVRAAIDEASKHGSIASVKVSVDHGQANVETNAPRAGLALIVVTTEDGVVTKIERGENRGLTLTNDAIARNFTRFTDVVQGASSRRVTTPMQRGTVVAMLQDPMTLRILAAAAAHIR